MNAIDLHAHVLVPEVDALVDGHPLRAEELRRQAFEMGRPSLEQNIALLPAYGPKLTDVAVRLACTPRSRCATSSIRSAPRAS
jgi:aminocarboxymuconate-semialdehyde decarboxylase